MNVPLIGIQLSLVPRPSLVFNDAHEKSCRKFTTIRVNFPISRAQHFENMGWPGYEANIQLVLVVRNRTLTRIS